MTAVAAPSPAPVADDGFAVYVHWPFCASKCPYCDFNSHVRATVDEARWRAALVREIDRTARLAPRRTATSVFFGGGTPSLMAPATVAAVLERIAGAWTLAGDAEVTLEANPGSVEAGRFAGYRAAGVDRLSLGVQALDDAALAFLGRGHDAAAARAALRTAHATFPRVSFDLIYARPGQTPAAWRRELAAAAGLAGEHLAVYQLTLEPGTAFHARARRGALTLPDADTQAALYDATQEVLDDAGLPAYEISNHARPGGESRHNLTYWRGGDYAGVGPGAHGRLTVDGTALATAATRAPEAWLRAAENGGDVGERSPLDADTRAAEVLMMGLRLVEGVSLARFAARTGRPLDDAVAPARVARLVEAGLLARTPTHLRATPAGRRVLNAVLAELLA